MKWLLEIQSSGLFQISNAVGRVLFDGAFRHELPWSLKERTARQIAEVPAMIAALKQASLALAPGASDYDQEAAWVTVSELLRSLPADE